MFRNNFGESQPYPVLQQNPDHAQGRAAQGEGVFRARRLFIDGPEADERVDLVGERDGDGDGVRGDAIAGALRFVVILDGDADIVLLALQFRVTAAHEALRLRKFADDFRHQVGLAEFGGARGVVGVGSDERREFPRQRLDAIDALALRAELLVEHDVQRAQLGHALVEQAALVGEVGQGLLVGLPEIQRVRQAGAHDAAIARRDGLAAIGGENVRHQNELVRQLAVGLAQHEAFLVGANGGANDLGGNVEEGFVEFAHQRDRPFDEAGDLVEQALVLDQLQPAGEGQIPRVMQDDVASARRVEHDLRLLKRGNVIVEAADADFARRHEAVAARGLAGDDPVDLEGHDLRRLGLGAEGREN